MATAWFRPSLRFVLPACLVAARVAGTHLTSRVAAARIRLLIASRRHAPSGRENLPFQPGIELAEQAPIAERLVFVPSAVSPSDILPVINGEAIRLPFRESSHYDLGRMIADAGSKITARGDQSPFEVRRGA